MKFTFEVEGTRIEFFRSNITGRVTLTTDAGTVELQSPLNPMTHFGAFLSRQWAVTVKGHKVVIEKERPVLMAGLRPQTYRVFVDDNLIVEQTGF